MGAPFEAERFLRRHLEEVGVKLVNNPDFLVIKPNTLGIDEVRELKKLASRKALGAEKFFLILPDKITLEAQNALLKLFEDPAPGTYFFLATREKSLIVPTLLSRMNIVFLEKTEDLNRVKDFYTLPLKKRLAFASKFAEDNGDLSAFLDDLIFLMKKEKQTEILAKAYGIRRLLRDQNIGARIVIEHLALVI